ncbi:WecB/TagA/CpsF family glycosyltransferase [Pseudooceanicola sp. LIPI14-2-Ac024]|uniref:WecB/TagA/CpsF family glycosyltransferase n=1 Tax=Pseudooceanicola sp. LIPI14-2-Ac024 TaxID=3344875 RepID=UPI0035CF63B2
MQDNDELAAIGGSAPQVNVLGVRISAISLEATTQAVLSCVSAGRRGYICVRDVHGVIACQRDATLKEVHNRSFLTVADGMPMVWAIRRDGHDMPGRVYGPDLMLNVLAAGLDGRRRHFLYGSTPEVLALLREKLSDRFPGVEIVGAYSPPFRALTEEEEDGIATVINDARPDIVWVGLGTPKQELWMGAMRDRLDAPMLIGVGAAFDFHAGLKPQAPGWMQQRGLEWLFRLSTEPRRLWRRYAHTVPNYIVLSSLQRAGMRTYTLPSFPAHGDVAREAAE